MKIFVYKTLFIALIFFVIFHLTFGYILKSYEKKFYNNFSSEKMNFFKNKAREELSKALEKDKILNDSDADLLKKIFMKLQNEIK